MTPSLKYVILPLPGLDRSYALSTGIPPSALLNVPIMGRLVDLAAMMNLTGLLIIELISL
jgi:hypothetical protein